MIKLIPIIFSFLIIGLFLYSKLLPYQDKLNPGYKKVFDVIHKIFSPLFGFLKKYVQPFQVGRGISVDMSQIIILVIFLALVNSF
ncbi:hypothetical protein [Pedobacter sp.]|uniref:hypothetical protein n=1 Tax=Pedobacter sp. TaxID=1411316 RepID=UPI003D7FBD4F